MQTPKCVMRQLDVQSAEPHYLRHCTDTASSLLPLKHCSSRTSFALVCSSAIVAAQQRPSKSLYLLMTEVDFNIPPAGLVPGQFGEFSHLLTSECHSVRMAAGYFSVHGVHGGGVPV